jgi:hypothetical protein
LNLDCDDIIGLAAMVNPNLSADSIDLDIDLEFNKLHEIDYCWVGYGNNIQTIKKEIPICPFTMRPHYLITETKTWKDSFQNLYKFSPDQCISIHRVYVYFVNKYHKYPENVDEFLLYIYYFYCVNRNYKTLPAPIVQFAQEALLIH